MQSVQAQPFPALCSQESCCCSCRRWPHPIQGSWSSPTRGVTSLFSLEPVPRRDSALHCHGVPNSSPRAFPGSFSLSSPALSGGCTRLGLASWLPEPPPPQPFTLCRQTQQVLLCAQQTWDSPGGSRSRDWAELAGLALHPTKSHKPQSSVTKPSHPTLPDKAPVPLAVLQL